MEGKAMNLRIYSRALSLIVAFMCASLVSAQSPQIVSTSPAQNEVNVPIDKIVSVTFNVNIGAQSINESSFFVVGNHSGRAFGAIDYDESTFTATFDPDEDFLQNEIITVTLTPDVNSVRKEQLIACSFSFTIESSGNFEGLSYRSTLIAAEYGFSLLPADFNEDRELDLAFGNFSTYPDLLLFLNTGSGDFERFQRSLRGDFNLALSSADIDYDGDMDLVSPMGHYETKVMSIVGVNPNNGDGTFGWGTSILFGSAWPWAPLLSDFDCDGRMDIMAKGPDCYRIAFQNSINDYTLVPVEGFDDGSNVLEVCDIDNDGFQDIIYSSGSLRYLFNNGDRSFSEVPIEVQFEGSAHSFATSDLDGDGYQDIVISNSNLDQITILSNNGDGNFSQIGGYDVNGEPQFLDIADLDGDSDIDIVSVSNELDAYNINIFWNDGNGQFPTSINYHIEGEDALRPVIGNFNDDLNPDIAIFSHYSDKLWIYWNIEPFFVCGDANGDDIVNIGDAVFLINYIFKFGSAPEPIEAGDANCDGSIDVGDAVYLVHYVFMKGDPPCCF
jgi:hypothetical protein